MNRNPAKRAPEHGETIGPVTIFDAAGRVVRVIPAAQLQRLAPPARSPWIGRPRKPKGDR